MFPAPELAALFIKTPLSDPSRLDSEPYMIPLVLSFDILTIPRVSLDVPAIVLMSLDTFDIGTSLTGHVFLNIILEGAHIYVSSLVTPQFCFKIAIMPN